MEPKVISPTSSEGWKRVILLNNSMYIIWCSINLYCIMKPKKKKIVIIFIYFFQSFLEKGFWKFFTFKKLKNFPLPWAPSSQNLLALLHHSKRIKILQVHCTKWWKHKIADGLDFPFVFILITKMSAENDFNAFCELLTLHKYKCTFEQ